MWTFSATKLKRFSQRSSEKYKSWPEIHGFPQKKKVCSGITGIQNENTETERMGDETLFNVCTIPTVLKHEVFGLSGKPATVRQTKTTIILAK